MLVKNEQQNNLLLFKSIWVIFLDNLSLSLSNSLSFSLSLCPSDILTNWHL
jgi:hypothetical protein